MAIRNDITINWGVSPRIINIASPSNDNDPSNLAIQDLHDTLRDIEDNLDEGMSYDALIDSAGKEDLGGGVSVGITSTLQNAQILFEARTVSDSAGTVTTANAAGTTLIDNAATFQTDGIVRGDTILNTTDGSVATVISVDSQTKIIHYALVDGTDNDWDFSDAYKIWNKVQTEVSGGNLVAVDTNGDSISAIVPSAFTYAIRTSASSATLTNTDSAATIADTVWDEALSGHLTAGTTGKKLDDSGGSANVLVDTTIASITSQTVFTLTAGSNDNDAYNDQAIAVYDASDNNDPSVRKVSGYVGASKQVTLDSAPDFTIIAGDGVKVFVTAPGTTAPTAAQVADAVWDEATADHTTAASYGQTLQTLRTGTAQAGAAGTITLDSGASAINDFYNDAVVFVTGGTGVGQFRTISGYAGSTKVATVSSNWITNPDSTSVFMVTPEGAGGGTSAATVADAVWDEATSGHTTTGSFGKDIQDIRTSQQKEYSIHLTGDHKTVLGNTYRIKLFILDFESELVDASSAPTITIYDSSRTQFKTAQSMGTSSPTGVYEYTVTIGGSEPTGTWESEVTIDLGGAADIKQSDYFEVISSGA